MKHNIDLQNRLETHIGDKAWQHTDTRYVNEDIRSMYAIISDSSGVGITSVMNHTQMERSSFEDIVKLFTEAPKTLRDLIDTKSLLEDVSDFLIDLKAVMEKFDDVNNSREKMVSVGYDALIDDARMIGDTLNRINDISASIKAHQRSARI